MKQSRNKEKIYAISDIIVFTLYIAIHLFLVIHHEAWRDEAQAWLIAKNLSLQEIFMICRVEGHPILWFLFLFPFAKLGFSFYYVSYISLIVMAICVYILLKESPLPKIVNYLVLLSTTFFYYNAVIFRIYCISVLIVLLICVFYKDRFEKPFIYSLLIALLFQTQIKYSGLAIGLCIEFIYTAIARKKNYRKLFFLLLPFISLVLVIAELLPIGEYAPAVSLSVKSEFISIIIRGFERIALSSWGVTNKYLYLCIYFVLLTMIVLILVRIIRTKQIEEYFGIFVIAACGIGAYYLITAFIKGSHTQMASILSSILLLIAWCAQYHDDTDINRYACLLLILFSFFSLYVDFSDAKKDIDSTYSYGKETAEYIEKNLENQSIILTTYDELNPVVNAFVSSKRSDIVFYDLSNERKYTFHQWAEKHSKIDPDDIVNYTKRNFDNSNIYYLSRYEVDNEHFIEVYSNLEKESLSGENYVLYRLSLN